ncbi:hypothetical protein BU25DRAFT_469402 [Macroventuria anomochaeta]|uniref:Uncharacterized protein n=1 Tax=Macroventuria anomochaeta TaxID=301207 RepID=A0ACB6S0M2_9PLEO|nr:uncharacterized protein BU25DRAFT_469402 [Macroventuria anomochaeta]KAF2627057.1 hypothetical protein BU25DRAFT_469402 [Macroventuria anomochaeta]
MNPPDLSQQFTTTVTSTVIGVSTVFTKSISYITQRISVSNERQQCTKCTPVNNTYKEPSLDPDSIAFWFITIAVVAFSLGCWFSTLLHDEEQPELAAPQRKGTEAGQKTNVMTGARSEYDRTSSAIPFLRQYNKTLKASRNVAVSVGPYKV